MLAANHLRCVILRSAGGDAVDMGHGVDTRKCADMGEIDIKIFDYKVRLI